MSGTLLDQENTLLSVKKDPLNVMSGQYEVQKGGSWLEASLLLAQKSSTEHLILWLHGNACAAFLIFDGGDTSR